MLEMVMDMLKKDTLDELVGDILGQLILDSKLVLKGMLGRVMDRLGSMMDMLELVMDTLVEVVGDIWGLLILDSMLELKGM